MCTKNLLVPLLWERTWTLQPSGYGLLASASPYHAPASQFSFGLGLGLTASGFGLDLDLGLTLPWPCLLLFK